LARNCLEYIETVKITLNKTFKIKDLGQLKFFLGLEIPRTHVGIQIFQRKYALDILVDIGVLNAKEVVILMIKKNESLFD